MKCEMMSPQKRQILTSFDAERLCDDITGTDIVEGGKWYVVSMKWWKEFLERKESLEVDGDKTFNGLPPIANDIIVEENKDGRYKLKERLVEQLDFQLIPEKVFNILREKFGVEDEERDVIERKVVSGTLLNKEPFIAVYPLEIKIANYARKNDVIKIEVSPGETLENIKNMALETLKITPDKKNSVSFYINEGGKCEPISQPINPAKLATLLQMNTIIYLDDTGKASSSVLDDMNGNAKKSTSPYSSRSNTKNSPGMCGLQNLGNTCFMNSAIQCLSNVPELTRYFYENDYEREINSENPLGTGGRLARAYGELVHTMWSGMNSVARPSALKMVIGQIAPRFNGYQQHDSQELLAFLLDGLHEDLNRIRKKPYIEDKESDGRPDEIVAKEAWSDYLKRNDSIIVDTFHGQLKSTLICPKCKKVSVKFDPFCFLSVPVPAKERPVKSTVFIVRKDAASKHIAKCALTHTQKTTVKQAIEEICKQVPNLSSDRIVMVAAHKSYGSNYTVEKFLSHDQPLVSQQFHYYSNQKDFIAYPVKEGPLLTVENKIGQSYENQISIPLLINFDPKNLTKEFVENTVLPYVRKVLGKKKIGIESSDDETEKQPPSPTSYRIIVGTDEHQFPEDPREPIKFEDDPDDNGVKLVIKWPNGNMFDPKIDDVVEREINVGFVNKNQYSLDECISLFTQQEQLGDNDSWYCPTCKEHVRAYKKLDLWKLPQILIIHLKRFSYTRWSRDKIETNIVIPVKDFDLKGKLVNKEHEDATYDLIAMSNHMGSMGGGHYTATALNNGRWCDFNDSSVSVEGSMPETLSSREAYLLTFRRSEIPKKRRSSQSKINNNDNSAIPTRYALRSCSKEENVSDMDVDDD